MRRSAPITALHLLGIMLLLLLPRCGSAVAPAAPTASLAPSAAVRDGAILPTRTPAHLAPPLARTESDSPALRWLAGTPCRTPCWEAITPGETTSAEAQTRLADLESIANLQQASGSNNNPAMLAWEWPSPSTASGRVYYYTTKPALADPPLNLVLNITLEFDHELIFQDIIARYGEPSHILLAADWTPALGLVYYFGVVYLSDGFLLQTQTADVSQKPALGPGTPFAYVVMFEPTADGFDRAIEPFFPIRRPSQLLVAWEGWETGIDHYCRDVRPEAPTKGCG